MTKKTLSLPGKPKTESQTPRASSSKAGPRAETARRRQAASPKAPVTAPAPVEPAPQKPAPAAEAPHRKRAAPPDVPARKPAPRPAAEPRKAAPTPRPPRPPVLINTPPTISDESSGLVRVSKLMSERGLCSRREADAFIERGWVFVDGEKVTELGTRVRHDQTITLSKEAKSTQLQSVTILLNKPVGFVSGQPEPGYKPAMSLIGPQSRWKEDEVPLRFNAAHLRGLAPAGRLDIDSTGLIVFTQDGRIAKKLIGEDSGIEKEYLVRVEGTLIEGGLKRLNHGLSLDGKALKPAKVSWQNEDQLRFVLREGKKRQIRRMCELVGLQVVGLKRIRIGSVVLGKLPAGEWRYLRDDERF